MTTTEQKKKAHYFLENEIEKLRFWRKWETYTDLAGFMHCLFLCELLTKKEYINYCRKAENALRGEDQLKVNNGSIHSMSGYTGIEMDVVVKINVCVIPTAKIIKGG